MSLHAMPPGPLPLPSPSSAVSSMLVGDTEGGAGAGEEADWYALSLACDA
jgi:hypothetical protein